MARDFRTTGEKDSEDLFAATPPLGSKKVLFKLAVSRMKGKNTRSVQKMKLMFVDVRKAHLNGVCEEYVYVELPPEAGALGTCGRLRRWLYGKRGAGQS